MEQECLITKPNGLLTWLCSTPLCSLLRISSIYHKILEDFEFYTFITGKHLSIEMNGWVPGKVKELGISMQRVRMLISQNCAAQLNTFFCFYYSSAPV